MTLNRAQRRALKHEMAKKVGTLAHPAPDSVPLRGGPMDGWVVKPNAPALRPDWHAGLIEASAAGLVKPGRWAKMTEAEREPLREQTRQKHPPGRYVMERGTRAPSARWRLS